LHHVRVGHGKRIVYLLSLLRIDGIPEDGNEFIYLPVGGVLGEASLGFDLLLYARDLFLHSFKLFTNHWLAVLYYLGKIGMFLGFYFKPD
jgi:hypothetical protein